MATVLDYVPLSGRTSYSITSDDGKRSYLVTPEAGPGKLSPVTGWTLWKADSTNTIARFPATEQGRLRAITRAQALADAQVLA